MAAQPAGRLTHCRPPRASHVVYCALTEDRPCPLRAWASTGKQTMACLRRSDQEVGTRCDADVFVARQSRAVGLTERLVDTIAV